MVHEKVDCQQTANYMYKQERMHVSMYSYIYIYKVNIDKTK